ncbi:unnamed protein product, partial [Arabidopsis halleri]
DQQSPQKLNVEDERKKKEKSFELIRTVCVSLLLPQFPYLVSLIWFSGSGF